MADGAKCYRCNGTRMRIQRDKTAFHVILWGGLFFFGVAWVILPFLPKRTYCAACGAMLDRKPQAHAKPSSRPDTPNDYVNGFKPFVNRADVLILDVETTGISERSEVIQIGVIDTQGKALMDRLCVPLGRISAESRKVHGIDRKRVKREGLSFPDAFAELLPILEGAAAVWAWNMPFDRRLLRQSCERNGLSLPRLHWRCAMREYAEVRGLDRKYVKLSLATDREGVEVDASAHNALGDCARVLGVMLGASGFKGEKTVEGDV